MQPKAVLTLFITILLRPELGLGAIKEILTDIGAERHRDVNTCYFPRKTNVQTAYKSFPPKRITSLHSGANSCKTSIKIQLVSDHKKTRRLCLYKDTKVDSIFDLSASMNLGGVQLPVQEIYDQIQPVTGFVQYETNSVLQGYIINKKFYGTVRMYDRYKLYHIVFYVEPLSTVLLYSPDTSLSECKSCNAVVFEYVSTVPGSHWITCTAVSSDEGRAFNQESVEGEAETNSVSNAYGSIIATPKMSAQTTHNPTAATSAIVSITPTDTFASNSTTDTITNAFTPVSVLTNSTTSGTDASESTPVSSEATNTESFITEKDTLKTTEWDIKKWSLSTDGFQNFTRQIAIESLIIQPTGFIASTDIDGSRDTLGPSGQGPAGFVPSTDGSPVLEEAGEDYGQEKPMHGYYLSTDRVGPASARTKTTTKTEAITINVRQTSYPPGFHPSTEVMAATTPPALLHSTERLPSLDPIKNGGERIEATGDASVEKTTQEKKISVTKVTAKPRAENRGRKVAVDHTRAVGLATTKAPSATTDAQRGSAAKAPVSKSNTESSAQSIPVTTEHAKGANLNSAKIPPSPSPIRKVTPEIYQSFPYLSTDFQDVLEMTTLPLKEMISKDYSSRDEYVPTQNLTEAGMSLSRPRAAYDAFHGKKAEQKSLRILEADLALNADFAGMSTEYFSTHPPFPQELMRRTYLGHGHSAVPPAIEMISGFEKGKAKGRNLKTNSATTKLTFTQNDATLTTSKSTTLGFTASTEVIPPSTQFVPSTEVITRPNERESFEAENLDTTPTTLITNEAPKPSERTSPPQELSIVMNPNIANRSKRHLLEFNKFFGENLLLGEGDAKGTVDFVPGLSESDVFDLRRSSGLTCNLCLWVQPHFAESFGLGGGLWTGVAEVVDLVRFANWIFRAIDFNQDGYAENIGFKIGKILLTDEVSLDTPGTNKRKRNVRSRWKRWIDLKRDYIEEGPGDSLAQLMKKIEEMDEDEMSYEQVRFGRKAGFEDLSDYYDPEKMSDERNMDTKTRMEAEATLRQFSKNIQSMPSTLALDILASQLLQQFSGCCAILGFVYHDLTPALAATTQRGLCSENNVGIISGMLNRQKIGKYDVFRAVMHTLGHLFGAPHVDPTDAKCLDENLTPFLNPFPLHPIHQLNVGLRPNSLMFSSCSLDQITMFLASNGALCLREDDETFCGNGILEDGEECDCGSPSQCNIKYACCGERDSLQGCRIIVPHKKRCLNRDN